MRIMDTVLAIALFCSACGRLPERDVSSTEHSTLELEVVSEDVHNFWNAFDQLSSEQLGQNVFDAYFQSGSEGLSLFVDTNRVGSPESFRNFVREEATYYSVIRDSSIELPDLAQQVWPAVKELQAISPVDSLPKVYFVIGQTYSGGTASGAAIVIAAETFSFVPVETSYGRPTLDAELVPFLIMHEYVHSYQASRSQVPNLSEAILREGAADFMTEFVMGTKVRLLNGPHVYEYGFRNKDEIILDVAGDLNRASRAPWLYSKTKGGMPQNLGYFVGYCVVKSYFQHSKNKKDAVLQILTLSNPDAIWSGSRFLEDGECDSGTVERQNTLQLPQ